MEVSVTPKAPTDRETFFQSLALFDRPEQRERVLEDDVDIDAFVERALGTVTLPPS